MKIMQLQPKTCSTELNTTEINELKMEIENRQSGDHTVCRGSSLLLSDFFEFTDFLIPHCSGSRMIRSSRQAFPGDYYSGL